MRAITHCPTCQTQFFVTEEQLNKHDGKVRCGQCLNVFNARAQFIDTEADPIGTPDNADIENTAVFIDAATPEWPVIHDELLDDGVTENQQQPITKANEPSAAPAGIAAIAAEDTDREIKPDTNAGSIEIPDTVPVTQTEALNSQTGISAPQPSYFDDVIGKSKFNLKKTANRPRRWLWMLGCLLLLLIAAAQSIYFLRDQIAIHYPNVKPYLIKACQHLACSVNLPKQIEFIVIDDSDMQEDVEHPGLMHLSSVLINKGMLIQAYPNLELTLTDVEDKPVLRRTFKPGEYLPAGAEIDAGFKAGEEIRIKLAITSQDVAVAGYRVLVTY